MSYGETFRRISILRSRGMYVIFRPGEGKFDFNVSWRISDGWQEFRKDMLTHEGCERAKGWISEHGKMKGWGEGFHEIYFSLDKELRTLKIKGAG